MMSHEFQRFRVVGAPNDWLVTITQRVDEGPMRLITNGRQHKPVGHYYSLKNGVSLPWESRVELHGFYHAEVCADVVRYRAQPHTLEIVADGEVRRYTPDREDRLADGRVEIVEIKDVFKAERDLHYAEKLTKAAAVYTSLGWSFRVIERAEIEAEPLFKAVEQVQSYRRTAVTAQDVMDVCRLFQNGPSRPLGAVQAVFAKPIVGMAKAYAMAVRRILAIDLSAGLGDDAPVRLLNTTGGAHA